MKALEIQFAQAKRAANYVARSVCPVCSLPTEIRFHWDSEPVVLGMNGLPHRQDKRHVVAMESKLQAC